MRKGVDLLGHSSLIITQAQRRVRVANRVSSQTELTFELLKLVSVKANSSLQTIVVQFGERDCRRMALYMLYGIGQHDKHTSYFLGRHLYAVINLRQVRSVKFKGIQLVEMSTTSRLSFFDDDTFVNSTFVS